MVKVNKVANLSTQSQSSEWQLLAEIIVAGEPGQKNLAIGQVTETIGMFHLSPRRMEQLTMAITRAITDDEQHTNPADAHRPILIRVKISPRAIEARSNPERLGTIGWGYFLIEKMVEEDWHGGEACHMVELYLYLEGEVQN